MGSEVYFRFCTVNFKGIHFLQRNFLTMNFYNDSLLFKKIVKKYALSLLNNVVQKFTIFLLKNFIVKKSQKRC